MKQFGIQLYSVRDAFANEESARNAFKELKALGYSYGQTAGVYPDIDREKFARYAKEADFAICGTHYDWGKIVNDVEDTVNYHRMLGTSYIGIGGMPTDARDSLDNTKKFICTFNEMAKIYKEYGFKLTYHNHSFEFVKAEGYKTYFDFLVDGLDPENTSFCLDTYWVQHGGADIRATIERLKGRIDILHLKDMVANNIYSLANGRSLSSPIYGCIGDGNIDFATVIPLAQECGTKYFVVEDDRCRAGEYMNDAKKSADYIKKYLVK